jgi:hypothetical protein
MGHAMSSCFPARSPSAVEYCYTIEEVLKVARTGDLVFESGNSVISNFVETECGSKWSHIAMVYKDKIFEAVRYDDTHTVKGKRNNKHAVGCRLRDIREYFYEFKFDNSNAIAIRHILTKRPCIDANYFQRFIEQKLETIVNNLIGKPYNSDAKTLLIARIGWNSLLPPDTNESYFCSSLVAKCYQKIGLLDKTRCPFSFLPDDFAKKDFPLLKPRKLQLSSIEGLSEHNAQLIQLGRFCCVERPSDNSNSVIKKNKNRLK